MAPLPSFACAFHQYYMTGWDKLALAVHALLQGWPCTNLPECDQLASALQAVLQGWARAHAPECG